MALCHSGKFPVLEVAGSAKAEEFSLVEIGLEQGFGEVGAQRPERRLPDKAETRGQAHLGAIEDEASLVGDRLQRKGAWLPQRSGVDENGALHAETVRNVWKREADFCRRRPEQFAAEGVLRTVGDPLTRRRAFAGIARAVSGPLEAANCLAALEEQVAQAQVFAAPAGDVAGLAAANQSDLVGDGIVGPSIDHGADVVHVAAETGEIL